MKKIKKSTRGLTFSLDDTSLIGKKFSYLIKNAGKEIQIFVIDSGSNTISRKKSGDQYKALVDLRSADVREVVAAADYMGIEELDDRIVIHVFRKLTSAPHTVDPEKLFLIDDVLCEKAAEIIILKGDEFEKERQEFALAHPGAGTTCFLPYYVASLFSGAGLLDKPFHDDPAYNFVYAADFDRNACETYSHNISPVIRCKDIREVTVEEIPDCDLVIGGPCCQAYSNSNRLNIYSAVGEAKRLLIDDYIRLVKGKKPAVFVIENVPQILTFENGLALEKLRNELPEYKLSVSKLRDTEMGGYTKRVRAIIIGSRYEVIRLPEGVIRVAQTVRDALKKVNERWKNYRDYTNPSEHTQLLMSYVPQGGNWQNIPPEVAHFPPTTHSHRYYRLKWDEPSITITNFRKPNVTHPSENRTISVAEAAALMGLEEDFPIYGSSLDSKQQQVANGVTQAMASFIKEHVTKALNRFREMGWMPA